MSSKDGMWSSSHGHIPVEEFFEKTKLLPFLTVEGQVSRMGDADTHSIPGHVATAKKVASIRQTAMAVLLLGALLQLNSPQSWQDSKSQGHNILISAGTDDLSDLAHATFTILLNGVYRDIPYVILVDDPACTDRAKYAEAVAFKELVSEKTSSSEASHFPKPPILTFMRPDGHPTLSMSGMEVHTLAERAMARLVNRFPGHQGDLQALSTLLQNDRASP